MFYGNVGRYGLCSYGNVGEVGLCFYGNVGEGRDLLCFYENVGEGRLCFYGNIGEVGIVFLWKCRGSRVCVSMEMLGR